MGFVRGGMQRGARWVSGFVASGAGDDEDRAAGEHGEGPHPEEDGVHADVVRFSRDEALAGDDEAS